MKKLLLATLLLSTFTAQAADNCKVYSDLAGGLMTARQKGVEMSVIVGAINQSKDEATKKLSMQMAIRAYSEPRFSTKEMQQSTITDFKNQWYLFCIKGSK